MDAASAVLSQKGYDLMTMDDVAGTVGISKPMFSFPSLALYEQYRSDSMQDAECQAAFRYAEETRCIVSYERSFFRPVFA